MKLPAVVLAGKARAADVVVPASRLVCCSKVIALGLAGCTVNDAGLVAWPAAVVTTTDPVVAPIGTGT